MKATVAGLVPAGIRGIGRGRRMSKPGKIILLLFVALFFFALPLLNLPLITTPDSDFGGVLFTCAIYSLVALGLNIVVGYAGLLDLGYVGFYAIGAYTVAILSKAHGHWPYWATIPIALAIAMVSGVVLGAPTLRVRGDYLAIVTLGFGEIIRLVAQNLEWTNGSRGIAGVPSPPNLGGGQGLFQLPHVAWNGAQPLLDVGDKSSFLVFGVLDAVPFYWLALGVIVLVLCADVLIKNSRVGRSWEATREDEDAAEIMGVPTFKFKLLAFAMGAFVGGLSGAIFAGYSQYVSPTSFQVIFSMLFLAAVIVGGAGNRWGVLVGAVLVVYLPERFRGLNDWRILIFGVALMALAIWRPAGLFPASGRRRAKKVEQELDQLEEGGIEHDEVAEHVDATLGLPSDEEGR